MINQFRLPRRGVFGVVSLSQVLGAIVLVVSLGSMSTGAGVAQAAAQAAAVDASEDQAMGQKMADKSGKTGESEKSMKPKVDPAIESAKKESAKLAAEADLRAKRLSAELASLKEESQRLDLEYRVAQQRQKNELLKWQLEKEKLDLELQRMSANAKLRAAQDAKALEESKREIDNISTERSLAAARMQNEFAEQDEKIKRMEAERKLAEAEREAMLADIKSEQMVIAAKNALDKAKLQSEAIQLQAETQYLSIEKAKAQNHLALRALADKLDDTLEAEIDYREDPFQDGVLHVTDRRIKLNGPIITGTAEYVTKRINFYNNESPTLPIFLMIDNCPGGSVMQGYRILKSMEASDAPIYVVVKSFAASMAAIITTLAERSYAYPNAVILHHQMSSGMSGNMTAMKEQLEMYEEWARRLMVPVSKKMGVTPERFVELMYENAKSSGDWEEFADEAVKLKWVNAIVTELREDNVRERPTGDPPSPWYWSLLFTDEQGQTHCKLPPLDPYDAYFMVNPGGFYR